MLLVIVRRALLVIGCLAGVWAGVMMVAGGFTVTVMGLTIRSNNPQRVLVIAMVAIAGYVMAGGRIQITTLRRSGRAAWRGVAAVVARPGLVAAAIAIALTTIAAAGSTRIAGGADAYGYVSQAELWLEGDLVVEQPWVAEIPWPDAEWSFSPLGYRPAEPRRQWAIVPTYAPGLPLLLAGAKRIGGQCALFAVVPLLAGIGVLATYGIGRHLVSPWAGVIAAWLVATSPTVLMVSFEPLTDVPAMSAWAVTFYLMLARGGSRLSPLWAGLAAAVAILIRPNLVPLAVPIAAGYLVHATKSAGARAASTLLFALGVLPAVVIIAILNERLYGSPLASGYGTLDELFAWSHVAPNVRRYLSWFTGTQTPVALLGLAALFIPARWIWGDRRDRRLLLVIAAFVAMLWAHYFAYLVWESWGFLRFLLPSWPFIMVGLAAVTVAVHDRCLSPWRPSAARVITIGAVVLLGSWTFATASRADVFGQRQAAAHEAPLGQLVRAHTAENSVVLVWERSGAIRYYSGRTTLRYDYLDGAWLDRAVDWLRTRGVHVYAVLDSAHLEQCRRRFAGQNTLAALERPVFLYDPARTALFDLTTPPGPDRALILYERDPGGRPACDPPVEATPLVLR